MHKLFLSLALFLAACSDSAERTAPAAGSVASCSNLPAGLSVIEQSPNGYFIRLASAERVPASVIKATADSIGSEFDRIDFCLDVAHERGDEYLSIIGNTVYNHSADEISDINSFGHE